MSYTPHCLNGASRSRPAKKPSHQCQCGRLRHISEAADTVMSDLTKQAVRYWLQCANDLIGPERDAALDIAEQVASSGARRLGTRSKERRRAALALATLPRPRPVGERAAKISGDPRFRRKAEKIHRLGARVVVEALAEIEARSSHPEIIEGVIDRFAAIDPKALHKARGDRMAPLPVHGVAS